MPPAQPMFAQTMPQMTPLGNNAMGSHSIHPMPTPTGVAQISGPIQFTSESPPFMQQKNNQKTQQGVMVNGKCIS